MKFFGDLFSHTCTFLLKVPINKQHVEFKPTAFRKAKIVYKIVYNFGLSECNRVNRCRAYCDTLKELWDFSA